MNYSYGQSVLTINNLSLSFGNKLILRDIILDIKDVLGLDTTGQVITLLGPSGIGKTQLMKMIAGLQEPSSGSILIGFEQQPPEAGKVGMVLQSYPLFEHRTVLSNLLLVSTDKGKIDELLEYFEVLLHKNKYPCQLSGGQRQRVAIIQQILSSDKFILLDEPFSGLDPLATKKLSNNIRKLADFNSENTIIISSHILTPALAVSDMAIMLGNEYDNENNKIEGAVITNKYNLLEMGLAYTPEIKKNSQFINLVNEINDQFK
jgi:ABC-type nitrate/sulfonate/bicarbonate transport system ATPase subunit